MSTNVRKHINQAKSNEKLLDYLNSNLSKEYYDWKITISFYTALHYISAYANHYNIILKNHKDYFEYLNPHNKKSQISFSNDAYISYQTMFRNCREVRYSGLIIDSKILKKQLRNYILSCENLDVIKKFLTSQGFNIL